jgi:hypothetical protein
LTPPTLIFLFYPPCSPIDYYLLEGKLSDAQERLKEKIIKN